MPSLKLQLVFLGLRGYNVLVATRLSVVPRPMPCTCQHVPMSRILCLCYWIICLTGGSETMYGTRRPQSLPGKPRVTVETVTFGIILSQGAWHQHDISLVLTALVKCLDLVLTRVPWIWQHVLCDRHLRTNDCWPGYSDYTEVRSSEARSLLGLYLAAYGSGNSVACTVGTY